MGKKSKNKYFRKIAAELESKSTMTAEKHLVLGAVLLDQGHTEFDGRPIIPGALYEQVMPVKMEINHARRMRKLHQIGGNDAVKDYLKRQKRKSI